MNRVVIVIAVAGILAVLSVGTLRSFTVSTASSGTIREIQCSAPIYGAGENLTGADADACNNEARTRAQTSGLVALGIAVGAVIVGRAFRTRHPG